MAAAVTASEHREVVAENWGLTELVEAATRCGKGAQLETEKQQHRQSADRIARILIG
jgi:hypothetical protein